MYNVKPDNIAAAADLLSNGSHATANISFLARLQKLSTATLKDICLEVSLNMTELTTITIFTGFVVIIWTTGCNKRAHCSTDIKEGPTCYEPPRRFYILTFQGVYQ